MIKIALCDDEKNYRIKVMEYCEKYFAESEYRYQCMEYAYGSELLENNDIDILLLDIEMDDVNGIEIKDFFQSNKSETRIIFISSHEEAMPEAFGRQVYGFIKKPLDYEQFKKKMDVVVAELEEEAGFVLSGMLGDVRKIFVKDILYIRAEGKYTKIFLQNQEHYVFSDKSIGEWQNIVSENGFAKCHRSYLANYRYVSKIQEEVLLVSGNKLPLSRRMESDFRDGYKKYIWRKAK